MFPYSLLYDDSKTLIGWLAGMSDYPRAFSQSQIKSPWEVTTSAGDRLAFYDNQMGVIF